MVVRLLIGKNHGYPNEALHAMRKVAAEARTPFEFLGACQARTQNRHLRFPHLDCTHVLNYIEAIART